MTFRNDWKFSFIRLFGRLLLFCLLGQPGEGVHELSRGPEAVFSGAEPQAKHGQGRLGLEEEPTGQLRSGAKGGDELIVRRQQGEEQILALLADVRDGQPGRPGPEQGYVDEVQDSLRRVAVAVHDFVQELVGVGLERMAAMRL